VVERRSGRNNPVTDAVTTSTPEPKPGAGALVEVDDLRTTFLTGRGPLRAVDGVSFALGRGETIGIVGESGSGKSVLVRSIMGLLPSSATVTGTVRFNGRDTRSMNKQESKHFWGREIAMVFQDPMTSLNPVKKIGTALTESMRFHLGLNKADARARAVELLTQVGIPAPVQRLGEYPHQLSGGMRQRVTIAIAISCWPKLLIADEPTTALDVTVQRQILDLLGSLQADYEMAMVMITHDLGVVAGRADRVGVMYAGRIVETAPTRELFVATRHPYTEALLQSIPKIERTSHTRLEAISGRPPDLVAPPTGCRFSPRCRYAQDRCLVEDPALTSIDSGAHAVACFFPVGTELGEAALARNMAAGHTATGLTIARPETRAS
jgi:peptide/nickel transport system ATP-binding protein